MTTISKSIVVPRPAEDVFGYLADFSNTAEWDPGVAEATKVTEGPVGVGSRFDLVALFRSRRIPISYVVTLYEPSSRVVLVGSNQNFQGTDDIGVSPEGDGARVDWDVVFEMKGLRKIFQPFLRGTFEKLSTEAMDGLKSTLSR